MSEGNLSGSKNAINEDIGEVVNEIEETTEVVKSKKSSPRSSQQKLNDDEKKPNEGINNEESTKKKFSSNQKLSNSQQKLSNSQQKLDEKKSWLPDINKSIQNISSLNLDDMDMNENYRMKKDKSKLDPYSSKAFHMKYQNPFKISFDITENKDAFKIREQERKKKKQEKEKQKKLHVYEKNMPKNRNFRELLEDDEDDKQYYQKLKKKNSELILLNQQKRSDRQFGKESLNSFIEKKREMFLLQYSLGVKRDEIKKLEDIIQAEEQKLLEDEKALEEDERKFDAFLRENDDNSVKAIKQFVLIYKTIKKKLILIIRY